jgi:hypothetical protein
MIFAQKEKYPFRRYRTLSKTKLEEAQDTLHLVESMASFSFRLGCGGGWPGCFGR